MDVRRAIMLQQYPKINITILSCVNIAIDNFIGRTADLWCWPVKSSPACSKKDTWPSLIPVARHFKLSPPCLYVKALHAYIIPNNP